MCTEHVSIVVTMFDIHSSICTLGVLYLAIPVFINFCILLSLNTYILFGVLGSSNVL